MSRSKRKGGSDDDLVAAAEHFLPHILMFYKRFEGKQPVVLLDLQSEKILMRTPTRSSRPTWASGRRPC